MIIFIFNLQSGLTYSVLCSLKHRLVYFDGFFCSGSSGEDQNQNRSNDEPKDALALLAAKDNLTNSVDVEKEFALDN